MPRLRTTTVLSVLLLGGAVAGTAWLSALSGSPRVIGADRTPAPRSLASRPTTPRLSTPRPLPARARVGLTPAPVTPRGAPPLSLPPSTPPSSAALAVGASAEPAPLSLRPLETPMRALPYRQLRAHRGSVVLKVGIDGAGRVRRAALGDSSGDAVLDDYALASVYAWRFAVPAGYAEGAEGEVTLRFTDDDPRLAAWR
jgi:protein TonB